MDFFTVPTATFRLLYCFFIISHDRRHILHVNVTKHPTTQGIVQQLREAFPFDSSSRFLIFDRDAKYGLEVPVAARSLSIRPVRTPFESPWQTIEPPNRFNVALRKTGAFHPLYMGCRRRNLCAPRGILCSNLPW